MTRVPASEASAEMVRSKAEIERRVGREVAHFAFPNEDASPTLVKLAAGAGYRTACAGAGARSVPGAGIHLLRRVGMHEGVGAEGSDGEALLSLAMLRAPKTRPA
jgi:hypothetical protein